MAWHILEGSKVYSDGPADTAIVLGGAVWGKQVSPVFEGRLEHAVSLYNRGQVSSLILTGGKIPGQREADSEVARDWVLKRGVPRQDIHIETRSEVTWENLAEPGKIMEAEGLTTALVISDPLHMTRAMAMAEHQGLNVLPSPTPFSRYKGRSTQLPFLAREVWWTSLLWMGLRI